MTEPSAVGGSSHLPGLQKRILITLVFVQIFGTVGVGVAPSVGILVAEDLTNSEVWAGLARTASTFGAAAMGIPLGAFAAKAGRRAALSTGWMVGSVGAALIALAVQQRQTAVLFAGLFLIGAGLAVSLQARFAATDVETPERHGRSLSLVVWVGTVGSVMGPNLAVPARVLVRANGLELYANVFVIAAVCMAVAAVLALTALRPDPLKTRKAIDAEARAAAGSAASGSAQPHTIAPRRRLQLLDEFRANARVRTAMLSLLSAQAVMVSIMTMTPVHMTHTGGSVESVGITISFHILGMYAFSPLVGQLVDRGGHRLTVGLGLVIFAVSLLLGALLPDSSAALIVSLFLLGLGWSFVNVAGSALFSSSVSPGGRASAQGGADAASNLVGGTAAFAAGPLLAASSFSAMCVIAAVALVPLTVWAVRGGQLWADRPSQRE